MITISEFKGNRLDYLSLLLLADEEPEMVASYIDRGWMFILEEDGVVIGECIATDECDGIIELKNIAVYPAYQRKGYGKRLVEALVLRFKGFYSLMRVGTGDSPKTIAFYESLGFSAVDVIRNYFVDNYSHEIVEDGVVLRDMIVLQRLI